MKLFKDKVQYEEVELTEAEASKMALRKEGEVVKFLGPDKVLVRRKVQKAIEGPDSPNKEDVVDSIDIKAKTSIPYQITRVKDKKRVVIKQGKFRKGQLWIDRAVKQRLFYADLKKLSWVEKKSFMGKVNYIQMLIFDVFYSEPLDPKNDTPEWSQEVEDMVVDSKVDQEVEVAGGPQPFKITRNIAIAMVIAAISSGFVGLSLNSMFHFVPNTVIHWVPTH